MCYVGGGGGITLNWVAFQRFFSVFTKEHHAGHVRISVAYRS